MPVNPDPDYPETLPSFRPTVGGRDARKRADPAEYSTSQETVMTDKIPAIKPLTSKQKKFLKGLAHPLTPAVQVGKEGLSQGVVDATSQELSLRELIKVKIGRNNSLEKQEAGEELAGRTASNLVQIIGKTLVLYRANPELDKEQRITLPKG